MTDDEFRVGGLDHVELTVPDRYEAADWYNETLGFEIVEEFEDWAELSAYPLMISCDSGDTMLALFEGSPSDTRGGFRRIAFEVSGENFRRFRERLQRITDTDRGKARSVTDLERAYSVFFSDPYGHSLEVTTYDYEFVSETLE